MRKLLYLCSIACLFACSSNHGNKIESSLRDTVNVSDSRYIQLLQAYEDIQLSNDSILFGFRIGMTAPELQDKLHELISSGRIINQDNKLYGLIPTGIYQQADIDNTEQFIVELVFHLDKQSTLTGIYASLFAPRFLLTASRFPAGHRPNAMDSYKAAILEPSEQQKEDVKFHFNTLLDLFRTKYGSENHIFSDQFPDRRRMWVSYGRLIELQLNEDYGKICSDYFLAPPPKSKTDFSEMIYIGSMRYTSVSHAVAVAGKVKESTPSIKNMLDSIFQNHKKQDEQREKAIVDNSGI